MAQSGEGNKKGVFIWHKFIWKLIIPGKKGYFWICPVPPDLRPPRSELWASNWGLRPPRPELWASNWELWPPNPKLLPAETPKNMRLSSCITAEQLRKLGPDWFIILFLKSRETRRKILVNSFRFLDLRFLRVLNRIVKHQRCWVSFASGQNHGIRDPFRNT